jgi:hypothetical protein
MLILSPEQVQYCDLVRQAARGVEYLPGIAYQDRFFVKGEFYDKTHKEEAIYRARQESTDLSLCLLIEEPTGFSLWYPALDAELAQRYTAKVDVVSTIDLEKLVSELRSDRGILIKDRRHLLKVYPQCWIGSEAVTWLQHRFHLSREDAIRLGQRLVDEKWMHHVADEHPFEDEQLFYRFYEDEKR